jgi:hypothetical protein
MSDVLDSITSFPSKLALTRGEKWHLIRVFFICGLVLMIALPSGMSGALFACITAVRVWFIVAIVFDLLLLIRKDKYKGFMSELLHSRVGGYLFALANIPFVMALFAIIMDFFLNFFWGGFWRETCALLAVVLIQVVLVKASRQFSATTGPTQSAASKGRANATKGLISTTDACVVGFAAFLLFHVVASALSDRAVSNVEELASSMMENIEYPLGARHHGLPLWLIFVFLFGAVAVLGRPRLTSRLIKVRYFGSAFETFLLSFLCFSLLGSQVEQFGIRRETQLGEKAAQRAQVAQELQNAIKDHSLPDDKIRMLGDSLHRLEQSKDRDEVARKAISHAEHGHLLDDAHSDQTQEVFNQQNSGLLLPASPAGKSRLLETRDRRVREEARAEAAAAGLHEVLSGSSSGLLDSVLDSNRHLTDLLISTVSDFISDNGEYSIKAVSSRLIAVLSGTDKPRDVPVSSGPDLIEKYEKEVTGEHKNFWDPTKAHENKEREVEPVPHSEY